jgi:hypothetical protein
MTEQINMRINDGGAMFAHEMSANFSPTQFMLDFKMITPRMDPRSKTQPSFVMQHNVIMVDPYHLKKIIEVLNDTVKKYEKEYGKISKPKSISKAEKKQKEAKGKQAPESVPVPNYLG